MREKERNKILNPLSSFHCLSMCVCRTDGAARIFTQIPLFYLSGKKSPVSRVSPRHWEREC